MSNKKRLERCFNAKRFIDEIKIYKSRNKVPKTIFPYVIESWCWVNSAGLSVSMDNTEPFFDIKFKELSDIVKQKYYFEKYTKNLTSNKTSHKERL